MPSSGCPTVRKRARAWPLTHMAIAAHEGDVEVTALEGIHAGFGSGNRCFMAAIVTQGAGSPRAG
jgi:hypothetical protein